jgi:hypothetical protein
LAEASDEAALASVMASRTSLRKSSTKGTVGLVTQMCSEAGV